jgi:hypothetical protein
VIGVGEFMPSRTMREPVTVISSRPAAAGDSCAVATPQQRAAPTAKESLVRRRPLIEIGFVMNTPWTLTTVEVAKMHSGPWRERSNEHRGRKNRTRRFGCTRGLACAGARQRTCGAAVARNRLRGELALGHPATRRGVRPNLPVVVVAR